MIKALVKQISILLVPVPKINPQGLYDDRQEVHGDKCREHYRYDYQGNEACRTLIWIEIRAFILFLPAAAQEPAVVPDRHQGPTQVNGPHQI